MKCFEGRTGKTELEEALTIFWELLEKKQDSMEILRSEILKKAGRDCTGDLIGEGYLSDEKGAGKFTEKGEEIARDIIRRQRIAERLLNDVLDVRKDEVDSCACEFEHILSKEVEESICTLLGHPRECPHGSPIPEGGCCRKARETVESIVLPLSKLKAKQKAKILYIAASGNSQLHKLMTLGIVPGSGVTVHQTYPSFVIQVDETQVALEEEAAKRIFVKRI